jgi:hypothetical protein
MLNFNENKVTLNIFIPITLTFILFMPNYLSFSCVLLSLFRPPGSGSAFGMRIRIHATNRMRIHVDPDPKHRQ